MLTESNHKEYLTRVFRVLVAEGDRAAQRLSGWAHPRARMKAVPTGHFMVAALSVPYHEGKFQHFRELPVLSAIVRGR